jgi:anion-transporting  ArsA/GET3 family ATPase
VYEAVRRGVMNRPGAYDAVVVDAPPTGRISQFLNVHEAVSGLAKVGPIRSQADSIMNMLHSSRSVVHLVTLLEDMPVTETEEAVAALQPTGIKVGTVIANMVTPNPLEPEVLRTAASGALKLKVPGLSPAQNKALAAQFAVEAARRLEEDERRETLSLLGLPLVDVSFDAGGIDEGSLFTLAAQLRDQMPAEVA